MPGVGQRRSSVACGFAGGRCDYTLIECSVCLNAVPTAGMCNTWLQVMSNDQKPHILEIMSVINVATGAGYGTFQMVVGSG